MSRQQLNVRVTQRTIDQVNALVDQGYETQSNVVMEAISNLYLQENTMSNKLTIGKIETRPDADPFTQAQQPTRTVINFDPTKRETWVEQEMRTGSILSTYYHGINLSWLVDGHPLEDRMYYFLDSNRELLERIAAGHSVDWDGHNHVGKLTEDARQASEEFERQVEMLSEDCRVDHVAQWYYWDENDWLDTVSITAETTDDEIAEIADNAEMAAKDDRIVFGYAPDTDLRQRFVEILSEERDDAREEDAEEIERYR